jgi:hypothetical protein
MRLIQTSEYRRTPWKNGAGTTFEIAAEPLASMIDTFDWRISMAQVASVGPFSSFPGTDAVSDWPLLNALLNTAGGATWVSLHHGGGVGMGYSQHSGVVSLSSAFVLA